MNIEPPSGYRILDPERDAPKQSTDLCTDENYKHGQWFPVYVGDVECEVDGFDPFCTYARKIDPKPEWTRAITDIEGLPEDGCVLVWNGTSWHSISTYTVRRGLASRWTHWTMAPPAPVPPVKSADELELEAVDAVADYGGVQTPSQCLKIFRAGRAFDRSQEKKP